MSRLLPRASQALEMAGVPFRLVATKWLLPLGAETIPPAVLYRVWDLLFLTRALGLIRVPCLLPLLEPSPQPQP